MSPLQSHAGKAGAVVAVVFLAYDKVAHAEVKQQDSHC